MRPRDVVDALGERLPRVNIRLVIMDKGTGAGLVTCVSCSDCVYSFFLLLLSSVLAAPGLAGAHAVQGGLGNWGPGPPSAATWLWSWVQF